jgi:hypothetical protein
MVVLTLIRGWRLVMSSRWCLVIVLLFTLPMPRAASAGPTREAVMGVVREGRPAAQRCWEAWQARAGAEAAFADLRLGVRFEVATDGRVTDVGIEDGPAGVEALIRCLTTVALTWRFPPFEGAPATFRLPLSFQRRSEAAADDAAAGRIDEDGVVQLFSARRAEIEACHEARSQPERALVGAIELLLPIQEDGRAPDAVLVEDGVGDPGFGACVLTRVRAWPFPRPSGGPASVIHKLTFKAKKK